MLDDRQCLTAFGGFIKAGREKQHLFQNQVAQSLDITQQYYSAIENGNRNVDFVMALKICQVLDLNLNDFIGTYVNK